MHNYTCRSGHTSDFFHLDHMPALVVTRATAVDNGGGALERCSVSSHGHPTGLISISVRCRCWPTARSRAHTSGSS